MKRRKAKNSGTPNVHDGLIVDYGKFTELTKDVLKSNKVLEERKLDSTRLNSPKWVPSGKTDLNFSKISTPLSGGLTNNTTNKRFTKVQH